MTTEKTSVHAEDVEAVVSLFRKLQAAPFFGEVVIGWQNGKICTVRVNRTFKTNELSEVRV